MHAYVYMHVCRVINVYFGTYSISAELSWLSKRKIVVESAYVDMLTQLCCSSDLHF